MIYKVVIDRELFGRRNVKVYVHDLTQRTSFGIRNRIELYCVDADTYLSIVTQIEKFKIELRNTPVPTHSLVHTSGDNLLYLHASKPETIIEKQVGAEYDPIEIKLIDLPALLTKRASAFHIINLTSEVFHTAIEKLTGMQQIATIGVSDIRATLSKHTSLSAEILFDENLETRAHTQTGISNPSDIEIRNTSVSLKNILEIEGLSPTGFNVKASSVSIFETLLAYAQNIISVSEADLPTHKCSWAQINNRIILDKMVRMLKAIGFTPETLDISIYSQDIDTLLRRYRKFSEMDNLTLAVFDGSKLFDVDYTE